MIFDSAGVDQTATYSDVFSMTDIAVTNPAQLQADATLWSINVDRTTAKTKLTVGTTLLLTAAWTYNDGVQAATAWTWQSASIPVQVTEEPDPLIDTSAYKTMFTDFLSQIDPMIKAYFWDFAGIYMALYMGFIPAVMTVGLSLSAVFIPVLFWGLFIITVPLLLSLYTYWYLIISAAFGTLDNMNSMVATTDVSSTTSTT